MQEQLVTENKKCYVCGSLSLTPILSLGELYVADFVTDYTSNKHTKFPLELVLCNKQENGCGLLQLKHAVSNELMYRQYWYRSGVNKSMVSELSDIVKTVESLVVLEDGDYVIDIGANDGTLLRSYQAPGLRRVGFEPARNLMAYARQGTNRIINEFFNFSDWQKDFGSSQARAITAIAMFYDLEDPNTFVADVRQCLARDGIFVIQMAYLPSMLTNNAFDNICHEHLQYYSLLSLECLLARHQLEVFDVTLNDVNGGSFRVYIQHQGANRHISPDATQRLEQLRTAETNLGLDERTIYDDFVSRILSIKQELGDFIAAETAQGKKVYVYGASTKGNTLLQFYDLDHRLIAAAADRNPDKWGRKTVGTDIPIISEAEARSHKPDYFLVLPWHFLDEFLTREVEFLQQGGKFIVPLPHFKIIGISDIKK